MKNNTQLATLPMNAPRNIIAIPTRNRWRTPSGTLGSAIAMLKSVQGALVREQLADHTWILIADGSNVEQAVARDTYFRQTHEQGVGSSRIFILTAEGMSKVSKLVEKKTNITNEIVHAVLTDPSYGSQRQKLDAVTAALVNLSGPKCQLALDDDIRVPQTYHLITRRILESYGYRQTPNSQLILPGTMFQGLPMHSIFEYEFDNGLRHFFEFVGRKVGDLKQIYPQMRVTTNLNDTTQEALISAIEQQRPIQAIYTSADEPDLVDADGYQVIAVSGLTTMMPDFVASKIAEAHLLEEFPNRELSAISYPSGNNIIFGYQQGNGNICSSGFARFLDQKTILYPWWFVSSEKISRANPLRTVEGPYRADNDLLPGLLKAIERSSGERNIYVAGINSVMFHERALYGGARISIIGQAIQSLVGKIPAYEIVQRIYFDVGEKRLRIRPINDVNLYRAPINHVGNVFQYLKFFANICDQKIMNLQNRTQTDGVRTKLIRYRKEKEWLAKKTGGFDFKAFYTNTSKEVGMQINFYTNIVDAMPRVVSELTRMIENKKFYVLEV